MAKARSTNYSITADKFFSKDERSHLLKICRERSELDLLHGRKTWPVRFMLIDTAFYSGLRVAEIAALQIRDIEFKGDPYLIVRNGKGKKKRDVYLDKELAKHLKRFIDYKAKTLNEAVAPDSPLFAGRGGAHVPPITLQKSFKEAIKAAGLPDHYSIHAARHTYATYLLADTKNLRYVQKQLGHSTLTMTALYADILPEENGRLANMIKRD